MKNMKSFVHAVDADAYINKCAWNFWTYVSFQDCFK